MHESQPIVDRVMVLKSGQPDRSGHTPDTDESLRRTDETGKRIICRACGNPITGSAARMEVNGKHEHVFFNPHGYMFELGCFLTAPGTIRVGPPSADFSWFTGHTWQITVCGRCNVHIGWYYDLNGSGFYGLILPALSEETD